jgi:hypothetical protein
MNQNIKGVIGIAGNAFVGKDSFCKVLIKTFDEKFKVKAIRRSLAGDTIRKNLKDISKTHFNIDIENPTIEEKKLIRPFMVEYGLLMRRISEGRYFIEQFEDSGVVDIITDIRYTEYPKDELHWLRHEKNGFLLFLERDDITPANEHEEKHNKILKVESNLYMKIPTFGEDMENNLSIYAERVAEKFLNKFLPFSDRTFFGL